MPGWPPATTTNGQASHRTTHRVASLGRVRTARSACAPTCLEVRRSAFRTSGMATPGAWPPRLPAVKRTFTTRRGLAGWVRGRGREVLLLHGGPGMTDYMQSLLPELDDFQVASFQQRGVAPSTLSGPFDVPTLRADAIEVLDTLNWESPVIIGHSWGGHLLLHLLAVTPTRVGAAPRRSTGRGRRRWPGRPPGRAAAPTPEGHQRALGATRQHRGDSRADTRGTPRGHGDFLAGILFEPGGGAAHPPNRPRPQRRELGLHPRRASCPRPIVAGVRSADSVRARRFRSPACDREHGHGRAHGRTHRRPSGQRSLPLARGLRLCAPKP